MPPPSGSKAWREKFDVSGKLSCNVTVTGDEAKAIVEFMEMEDLRTPAAAIRMLLGTALASYPEWAASAALRRAIAIEVRSWATQRTVEKLREVATELEAGIAIEYEQIETKMMEDAMLNYAEQTK